MCQRVRYVVIIVAGDSTVARLMLDTHLQIEEFDGGSPEVLQMIQGLAATKGASGREWDAALQGHTALERMAADIYTLAL